MKLLFLLGLFVVTNLNAQVDLPRSPENNAEIPSFLWEKYSQQKLDPIEFFLFKDRLSNSELSLIDKVILKHLENHFLNNKNLEIIEISNLTEHEAISLYSKIDELNQVTLNLSPKAKKMLFQAKAVVEKLEAHSPMNKKLITELLDTPPDSAHYNNGEYKDKVRLFLICREDRNYPCIFIIKDIFGNFVRTESGELWSIPALAKSARNIPFYKTNGETPSGVHTIDSVMPEANRQAAFGKFRRTILNWIPSSQNESNTLLFIPTENQKSNWWKRANVSRDAGRKYLRIHGTGRINDEPSGTYFPHIATSGCISTREGSYFGYEYADQKLVLDKIMMASKLLPTYSNETLIKGVLYVLNLNELKSKVTLKDLKEYGVE